MRLFDTGFLTGRETGRGIPKGEAHNLPKFLEAAKKDGGRSKAITDYGKTSDLEFYAENLSLFVTQPDMFQTLRPNIYQYFVAYEWEAVKDPELNSPSTVSSTSPRKVP
jgi:Mlc titration factor MtfA (ptsG expression regulator)